MKHAGTFLAFLSLLSWNAAGQIASGARPKPVRVLLVVAHPDDEYEMAGTIYRIAQELSGRVDQLILTDGEAGYRYSSLAETYYGLPLTRESAGRAELPRIRRREARRAAKILGIRHQWFLNEKDEQFTLDAEPVLRRSWNQERVLRAVRERLRDGHYDFIFVLLPAPNAHGEHKAATILTLQAIAEFPQEQRPVILGAQAGVEDGSPYHALPGLPLTGTDSSAPQFQFDRELRFGYRNSLSYQIVVNWVIAEHKSQGLFQTRCGQDRFENFWVFRLNRSSAIREAAALFQAITPAGLELKSQPAAAATGKSPAATQRSPQ